jgi:hypothetical protein
LKLAGLSALHRIEPATQLHKLALLLGKHAMLLSDIAKKAASLSYDQHRQPLTPGWHNA